MTTGLVLFYTIAHPCLSQVGTQLGFIGEGFVRFGSLTVSIVVLVSLVIPTLILKLILVSLDWHNQLDNALLFSSLLLLKQNFHILLCIRTLQSIVSVAGLP
jgi:hypothetical protein